MRILLLWSVFLCGCVGRNHYVTVSVQAVNCNLTAHYESVIPERSQQDGCAGIVQ
jgi:hypothetical protein